MDSRLEARLIELSRMSTEERLQVSQDSDEVQGYLQALEYLSSVDPPAPSQTKMWAGHARLMAGLEDSRPTPLLARLFGGARRSARAAPVALAALAVVATASSAAVITGVAAPSAVVSEVLGALGINDSPAVSETPPLISPPDRRPVDPSQSSPGANGDELLGGTPPVGDLPAQSDEPVGQPALQPGQGSEPPGQGGENPGNGIGQGGTPPGQGGENPGNGIGQEGTPPGQGGENPGNGVGQDGMPPGQGGENPGNGIGQGGTPPGQGSENPSNGQSNKP
jgi:hypothetical protein